MKFCTTLRWREMDSNFRFRARSTFAARPRVGWRDSRNLLSPPPLSPRDHPACGLAISALHAELSRRRGTPRRTGARHLLRERRSWVLNFGPVIGDGYAGSVRGRAIAGISTRWWCGSPARGCTVACRRPRRRGSRHAGSAAARY